MLHESNRIGALGGVGMSWSRWCAALALLVIFGGTGSAGEPSVTARAAIAVDATSGETLWEQNADAPLPPASTTKVLTAILALESGRLDDWFEVSSYAAATPPSKLGLRPRQRMQLRDLLYALLLKSANDASTVVAEGLAGSESRFAARMTARAHELGATASRFENAHGLTAPGHWSTARDLARIFRYGLRLPEFREILETPSAVVRIHGAAVSSVGVRSHNRLLRGWTHQVIGKTGYTRPARRCFVGAAATGGREVVIAVLGSHDLWSDVRQLVAYGFGEDPGQAVESHLTVAQAPRKVPGVRPARQGEAPKKGTRAATLAPARRIVAPAQARVERQPPRGGRGTTPLMARRPTSVVEGDRDDDGRAGSRYAVQLGPFPNREAVKATRIALLRRGFQSDAVGASVRLGAFPSRREADRLAGRLRGSGYRPTVVAVR